MFRFSRIFLLIFFATFAAILSCKESEIAENVTLTLEYPVDEEVNEFDGSVTLDAFDESQVLRTYGENITGIEIRSISVYLTYFTGPASQMIVEGILEVSDEQGEGPAGIASINNVILQDLIYEHKELNLYKEGKEKLESLIFNDPHAFSLRLSGVSNLVPNNYGINVEIVLRMIAKPL